MFQGLFRILLGVSLVCVIGSFSLAQEESKSKKTDDKNQESKSADDKGDAKAAADKYAKMRTQWDDLNEQITDAYRKLRRSSTSDREKLKDEYVELVNRANDMLPKLRDVALAAYQHAPNKDEKLARLLVGIIAYDVRRDNYESALSTAKTLIENNCPIKALHNLAGKAAYCLNDFDNAETYLKEAKESNSNDPAGTNYLADIPTAKEAWKEEQAIRKAEAEPNNLPRVKLETTQGAIVLELFENEAPMTVANFIHLVEKDYYKGLTFHRVLSGFMAQGGCPKGDGTGEPGYKIYCECYTDNHRKHFRGSLSMANSGRDTGGSQFFITFRRTADLDGKHAVFGRVIEGMDVLAKIKRRDPNGFPPLPTPDKIVSAKVERKRDHKYEPTKVKAEEKSDDKDKKKNDKDKDKDGKKKPDEKDKAGEKAGKKDDKAGKKTDEKTDKDKPKEDDKKSP